MANDQRTVTEGVKIYLLNKRHLIRHCLIILTIIRKSKYYEKPTANFCPAGTSCL